MNNVGFSKVNKMISTHKRSLRDAVGTGSINSAFHRRAEWVWNSNDLSIVSLIPGELIPAV